MRSHQLNMIKQRSKYFGWLVMLLTTLVFSCSSLLAQDQSASDRIYFQKNRYHKKTGWVNSIGFYFGNWDEIRFEYPERFTRQFEYLGYKLVKPKLGIGAGGALKFSPTGSHGRDSYFYYEFAEVFAYAKVYLNDSRRRLYIDTRFGYAHALGDIRYWCDCSERYLSVRYTSGPTFQTGIGLEIAGSKAIRKGIKLSYYQNYINKQWDRFPEYWETTSEGIIKRKTSTSVLKRLVVGISLYI